MLKLASRMGIALAVLASSVANGAPSRADDAPTTRREAAASWASEGLQPISVRGMDLAYAQPGASLQAYRAVLVKPVSVAFQKNWARDAAIPSGTRLYPRDIERVREDMADVVGKQLKREFENGGWQVVDAPGAGVLEIEVQVSNLYLNAPDFPTPGIQHSYARSFGEFTMVANLRDSGTGVMVMRVLDRVQGHDHQTFERVTRVRNAHEVGIATSDWARALRRQLELARVAGEGSNGRP